MQLVLVARVFDQAYFDKSSDKTFDASFLCMNVQWHYRRLSYFQREFFRYNSRIVLRFVFLIYHIADN